MAVEANQCPRRMQVLLVEDSLISAEAVRGLLLEASSVAVELRHVESLADVPTAKSSRPDIVLLDLFLPDSQGVETIHGIQKKLPGVPIVALTADSSDALALDVVRAGAQDYIVKGRFDADALIRSMRYAIERAHGEQLKQQLIHADRLAAIGRLVAGVAHEISNPATFVLASTGLLKPLLEDLEGIIQELASSGNPAIKSTPQLQSTLDIAQDKLRKVREICDHNASGIDRICSVVRDLRGFSRFEPAEAVLVAPDSVVEDVSHLVANSLRHQAKLTLSLGVVPPINLPRGRLDQILTNLLMNAAQAMPYDSAEDGSIRISTRREGNEVAISVEDNGSGITQEQQKHVFEPFFTTKPRGVGLGLGLSICREIARAHGGDITCTSEPGIGSRFEVRFPVASTSELRPISLIAPVKPLPGKARVLFVDDEPRIREVYHALLSTEFDVTIAVNGRHAVEVINQSPEFDVIVSDLMMPQMGAVDLIEALRPIYANVVQRFVVYTGGALSDRAQALVDKGEVALLYKPLRLEELTLAIRRRLPEAQARS